MAKRSLTAFLLLVILLSFVGAAFSAYAPQISGLRPAAIQIRSVDEASSGQQDPVYDSEPVNDHPWGGAPPNQGDLRGNVDLGFKHGNSGIMPAVTRIVFRWYVNHLIR